VVIIDMEDEKYNKKTGIVGQCRFAVFWLIGDQSFLT